MTSLTKMLSLLEHFDDRNMTLDVARAAEIAKASRATAYRYLRELTDAGLLAASVDGAYVLGPRVMELEALMRQNDPLLNAARTIIRRRAEEIGVNIMLCSYYGSRVLCADLAWPDRSVPEIYQRGRSMPIFRGAMAKAILANLSDYQRRQLYKLNAEAIREAGLADSWKGFAKAMSDIRAAGVVITRAEVFDALVGVAAPVCDVERRVLGSVVFVIGQNRFDAMNVEELRNILLQIAQEIERSLELKLSLAATAHYPPVRAR